MVSGVDISSAHPTVRRWLEMADLSVYGDSYVLMRNLYFDYIVFCRKNGIKAGDICSDRIFSKSLQGCGYDMKYSRRGTEFRLNGAAGS